MPAGFTDTYIYIYHISPSIIIPWELAIIEMVFNHLAEKVLILNSMIAMKWNERLLETLKRKSPTENSEGGSVLGRAAPLSPYLCVLVLIFLRSCCSQPCCRAALHGCIECTCSRRACHSLASSQSRHPTLGFWLASPLNVTLYSNSQNSTE